MIKKVKASPNKYFAYGSNMDPDRMRLRGISFSSRTKATLQGWELVFNKIKKDCPGVGYANIAPALNACVEGILYQVENIDKLDPFEGVPTHYKRSTVNVAVDGGMCAAEVYVAVPQRTLPGLKPTREYLAHLIKGSDLLSADYVAKLKETPTAD